MQQNRCIGQQQNLRVNFGGIYRAIRALLQAQIGKLGAKYAAPKDETIKAELDRLTAELAKLVLRKRMNVSRPAQMRTR